MVSSNKTGGIDMTVNEYLEENDLDYDDIILKNEDGEVWFYRYFEDEKYVNAEPTLEFIEDDDEYEAVADAFDEYLDNAEFDELVEE